MRRPWGALLLALALVAAGAPALGLPGPATGSFQPHAPIAITSNAGFTAANGVVAGSGTNADPYVIAGWQIATPGTAILIRDVTAAFVVRDNLIDGGIGVEVRASTAANLTIAHNQILVRGTGVFVANADVHIANNSFEGHLHLSGQTGVRTHMSNSRIEANAFLYVAFAISSEAGSPKIICNDIHDDVIQAAISVKYTTRALIECNTISACVNGVIAIDTFATAILNNTITSCAAGIDVRITKDVDVRNNTIRFSHGTQVRFEATSGNFSSNLVIDGRANAVIVVHSPIVIANNTIGNHLGIGLWLGGNAQPPTTADVEGNVVSRNSVGIKIDAGSVPHLHANVVVNNSIGIDLPYGARQTIVNMTANIVNGVNVDGSLNASQRVFFYKQANVTIHGQIRDSGFSAGYYGSLTAQGGVVLYEVDTVEINATVVSHHNVGVGVVNSFNVNVNSSLVVSNLVGIKAEAVIGSGQVPPCVVGIKDTNVSIPVDPIATAGIDLRGCLGIVANVSISVVDIGIKADAAAALVLNNSTITNTRIGLDVVGAANATNITGNDIANNRIGARFVATTGLIANNTFRGNAEVGVRLEGGARLSFHDNHVYANGVGLLDARTCAGPGSCSSVHARRNLIEDNFGAGVVVNGESSWRGDVVARNEGPGLVLGGATLLRGVLALENEGDGARISAAFEIEDSVFANNDEDGLEIHGRGSLRDSNFTFNEEAGIRSAGHRVAALHLNVSHNFDGIIVADGQPSVGVGNVPLSVPSLLPYLWALNPSPDVASVFDIHRSTLMRNERDAIRAGVALVNATHNYFGTPDGPVINVGDQIGAFRNGVSPGVRFVPYYVDPQMTTAGPLFLL